ncbi:MAG: thioesterase family protein [Albidovulum sp.]
MNTHSTPRPFEMDDFPDGMWSTKTKFRHGQCDPAGIVYTPNFFDVFNRAIEEWFDDALRIPYQDVIGRRRIGLGYVAASATFFAPFMMGDEAEVFVAVDKFGIKSYTLTVHLVKDQREAVRGTLTTVTTNLDTHQSTKIPDDILEALLTYAEAYIPDRD